MGGDHVFLYSLKKHKTPRTVHSSIHFLNNMWVCRGKSFILKGGTSWKEKSGGSLEVRVRTCGWQPLACAAEQKQNPHICLEVIIVSACYQEETSDLRSSSPLLPTPPPPLFLCQLEMRHKCSVLLTGDGPLAAFFTQLTFFFPFVIPPFTPLPHNDYSRIQM